MMTRRRYMMDDPHEHLLVVQQILVMAGPRLERALPLSGAGPGLRCDLTLGRHDHLV